MRKLPSMVSMAHTTGEIKDALAPSMPSVPIYPYGLAIRLGKDELEKLDVDYDDWEVGDNFHLFCLAKITSIRKSETTDGHDCCVEMQITEISGESEEEEENEENENEYEAD